MSTTRSVRTHHHGQYWLYAGLLAFVPHLAAVIYSASQRSGFSHTSQYLSELGERGAPSAAVANHLGILPTGLLFIWFGFGLARHYRSQLALFISGALIALHGACRVVAAIFVCDLSCRPSIPSASQLIHNAAATLGFLALTAALFTGAAWMARRQRGWFPVASSFTLGAIAVASQALLVLHHGGPTGIYQRVALGALQLGVSVLAFHMLVRHNAHA